MSKLCKKTTGRFFLYVFILNLLSNYVYLKVDNSLFAYVCIFCLSAFVAFVEYTLYLCLPTLWLKKTLAIALIFLHNILLICDFFLLSKFQMVFGQDAVDILAETNHLEIANFFQTYITPNLLVFYCILIFLLNLLVYFAVKFLVGFNHLRIGLSCLAIFGFCIILLSFYHLKKYGDGMSIPQYTSITRCGYALYVMKGRKVEIQEVKNVCKNLLVRQTLSDRPTIVVVVGESFSIYHSSLYGYKKMTNPLLMEYKNEGSLFLFDNVVSLYDFTHGSLRAAFSLDSLGIDYVSQPLFPACFKAAKYRTYMYDNQYLVGAGITFLCDKELSEAIFDYRNKERFQYDGMMVDDVQVSDSVSFYVIHLFGQHYYYSQRYPKCFSKFNANDYDYKYTQKQRQIMADYDNATLYNDYVIDKILKKFTDKYCCVFYFSDHGEEVYELRDYMGHCSAERSPNLNYQIRVPLMVWLSPSFYAKNGQLVEALHEAEHYPICTDDIGHSIIDVAGIDTKNFAPTRSFVNKLFKKNRHRIVLNHINYDKEWMNKR